MKDVYQVLVEHLMNERLDRIAFQDKDFCIINEKLDGVLEQYRELGLPEKDVGVIDRVFELYAAQCAKYAECAYRQGIEDSVQLLKEMGVIGK